MPVKIWIQTKLFDTLMTLLKEFILKIYKNQQMKKKKLPSPQR